MLKYIRKGYIVGDRNQEWWTEDVAEAVGEKKVWKRIEKIMDRGGTTRCKVAVPEWAKEESRRELWIR